MMLNCVLGVFEDIGKVFEGCFKEKWGVFVTEM